MTVPFISLVHKKCLILVMIAASIPFQKTYRYSANSGYQKSDSNHIFKSACGNIIFVKVNNVCLQLDLKCCRMHHCWSCHNYCSLHILIQGAGYWVSLYSSHPLHFCFNPIVIEHHSYCSMYESYLCVHAC